MQITIEAETEAETAYVNAEGKPVFPMTFPLVKRFAVAGQSIAGDVHWYEGPALYLLGDLDRLRRIMEWNLTKG